MHPAAAARIGCWGRGYGSIQRVDRSLDHLPGCFPRPALRAHLLAGMERGRAANTGQRDQACAALASSLQSGALVGSEPVCCQGAVRGQGLRETTTDNGSVSQPRRTQPPSPWGVWADGRAARRERRP